MSRSELAAFVETGRIEETIYFGPGVGSKLTYVLERNSNRPLVDVVAEPGRVTVLLPVEVVQSWANTEETGVSGIVDLGVRGSLSVLVEKDFACLDRGEVENTDTFPNPLKNRFC